jgi:lipopolysaccharide cholinephosphotransferase
MDIQKLLRPDLKDEYGILKLQNIILNIMLIIDGLCDKYHIEYYIIGGTALGAVRHGGFIPWDDDLDIAMTRANYIKFLDVCRKELDPNIFFLQEGRKDWHLFFSKLRLRGTVFNEYGEGYSIPKGDRGIFVDIFPLDNAANKKIWRVLQYFCSKMLIANALRGKKYRVTGLLKKMLLIISFPLNNMQIRKFFFRQVIKYNYENTDFIGDFFDISRLKDVSYPRDLWGTPQKIKFEDTELYGPEKIKDYLNFYFGDYMTLPPVDKRKCGHNEGINFGKY